VNLDDILALAETGGPRPLERARAHRFAQAVQSRYDRSLANGYDIIVDTDLSDPLTSTVDEAVRVARAAELAKLGTITWRTDPGGSEGITAISWSDEMARIFGHAPGTGRPDGDTLDEIVHPDDIGAFQRAVAAAWRNREPGEVSFRARQPNDSVRYVHCHLEVLSDLGEPTGIIATGEDVTDRELARRESDRLAKRNRMRGADRAARDFVTGLPTRGYFIDEVDRARRTTVGALVVVATEPRDRLPDGLTDEEHEGLTKDVADHLRAALGPELVCGLAGPGLWGVLAEGSGEHAEALANRVVEILRNKMLCVRQTSLGLAAWAGVVRFGRGDSATGFDLLVDGEHSAREARRTGNDVKVLDRPESADVRTDRCRNQVRRAVATGRFTLVAQPIIDLELNEVTRHEILLRVPGAMGKPIAPWAFLDMAERVGEILTVDKWVIDQALKLVGRGAQTSHYQINISGKSLADPGLLDYVIETIDQYGVFPECLTFEITETALIENRNEAMAFAKGIQEIGCQLALDDFGTGYASLADLRNFPVDLVKVDGSFIVDLPRSPADQAIVSGLVTMCGALGIRVEAEYVQDVETIALLKGYGVDFVQGYPIGRPRPIAESLDQKTRTIEMELRHSAM